MTSWTDCSRSGEPFRAVVGWGARRTPPILRLVDVAKHSEIQPLVISPAEQTLPLPCPFCETNPIVRLKTSERCTYFRCRCCRRVWGVPVTARPS